MFFCLLFALSPLTARLNRRTEQRTQFYLCLLFRRNILTLNKLYSHALKYFCSLYKY